MTAASNLVTGYLVDRISPRLLVSVMLMLFAGMMVFVPFVTRPEFVWLYGAAFGIVHGMQGSIMGSSYAYYFGRDHIGAIKGFASSTFVAGSAAGPMIFALGADAIGSYLPVVLGTGGLTLIMALFVTFLGETRLQENLVRVLPEEALP